MTMTVYESMAHALLNQHSRHIFTNINPPTIHGFAQRFWRWVLIAYGERLYDLPGEMGLPPLANHTSRYGFPLISIEKGICCGLAPTKLLKFPTITGFHHQYTPIHIGTALLKFGREEDIDEADTLLSTSFMRSVYPGRTASQFTNSAFVNPYGPEDVGRKPFDIELLTRPDGDIHILDEFGNSAWFPTQYVEKILGRVEPVFWYYRLCEMDAVHGKWTGMVQSAAASMLRPKKDGPRMEYKNTANYLRHVRRSVADHYYRELHGVRESLCIVRGDASVAEMHRGLRALALSLNDRTKEIFRFLGRPLTLEDFQGLTPKQALTILYYAPYDAVKDVITTSSNALGTMFFTLTDKDLLWKVTNSMSTHTDRVRGWFPDTADGNLDSTQPNMQPRGRQGVIDTWTTTMTKLVDIYGRAKEWRDELVDLAQPDVLLLALCRMAASQESDPLPLIAIENVLRSHPNIVPIQETIARMPTELANMNIN